MEKMVRSYDYDTGCQRYTGNGMSYLSLHAFSSSQYLFIRDIDIEPGIKEARFVCPDGEYAMQFLLEKCMKQFPDVEKIYIGPGVNSLHFSNFMFPNVKYVESDSKSFLSGQMLVSTSSSLYNVFCRKPEDVIDLNKVMFIEKISRRILVTSVVMQRAYARLHQTRTGFLFPRMRSITFRPTGKQA